MIEPSKYFLIAFSVLLLAAGTQAQNNSQNSYLIAKKLLLENDYKNARSFFNETASSGEKQGLKAYALFYSALCSYKLNELEVAKLSFNKLAQKKTTWSQLDEVYLWLGKINFEMELGELACAQLNKIKLPELQEEAALIKNEYLSTYSYKTLKELYNQYPQDLIVAKMLARKIANQPPALQDKNMLNSLIKNKSFDIDKSALGVISKKESEIKKEYHIALFAPLFYKKETPKKTPKTIILDFYQGLLMASEELNKDPMQPKIILHTYDTKRDTSIVKELMQKKQIKNMDMFIGPLMPETSKVAAQYNRDLKINIINPFSDDRIESIYNPYVLYFTPSYKIQAQKTAAFAKKHVQQSKTAVVLFEEKSKKKDRSQIYAQAISTDSFDIILHESVSEDNVKPILSTLRSPPSLFEEEEEDENETKQHEITTDRIGHIYVDSDDPLVVANTLSAVSAKMTNTQVIGNASWTNLPSISFDQLEKLGAYLFGSLHVDYHGENGVEFRDTYLERYGEIPKRYAFLGYELLWFFGQMLQKKGTLFQYDFKKHGFYSGKLTPGFSFENGSVNSFVPIIKFQDGEPIIIDIPE